MTRGENRAKMRRLRRSERGLSEIVGTLMLVVIVVSAAAILAAFVATYQQQVQKEQSFTHDQSLESIHILSLTSAVGSGAFTQLGFILASEYVNPAIVLGIAINNNPLKSFAWENLTTGTSGTYVAGEQLTLASFQEISITLDLNPADTQFSFLSPAQVPLPNAYLKFDIYTLLQNDFSRIFLPPAPIGIISQQNPSGGGAYTLLDGSDSFQPGTNASIVSWNWIVTGGSLTGTATYLSTTNAISSISPGTNGSEGIGTYTGEGNATFTVPQNFEYQGTDTVALTAAADIVDNGAGCTSTGSISPISGQEAVSGTTLTVPFTYSVTVTGCTGAGGTVQFAGPGDATLTTPNSLYYAGEETQVSPALGSGTYSITLMVTNNDGLVGTVSLSFTPPP